MRKILGIYDTESGYGERLAGYLSVQGRLPFRVVVFTSEEMLVRFAEKEEIHMLLLQEKAITQEIKGLSISKIMLLTEEPESEDGDKDLLAVYKYQSAKGILEKISGYYEAIRPPQSEDQIQRNGSGLITVYSPVHDCYKTTFALLYGQLLARGERVLFISLEVCAGFEIILGLTAGADLSDALYYYRQGRLAQQLPDIVQHREGLDILMPVQYPEDLHEVRMEELLEMLHCILRDGLYTAVVVDAGEALYRPADILIQSQRIFMPRKEDQISIARLQAFENCMRLWGYEDVWQRTELLQLPVQTGLGGPQYLEQLMWGSMGDYVRSLQAGEYR